MRRRYSPTFRARGVSGVDAAIATGGSTHNTRNATTTLRRPADTPVHARPMLGIRTKPLTSTPATPPMLLQKYSVANERPGSAGNARMNPPAIKGNVIPSRIDCGRMSAAPRAHLKAATASGEGSHGMTSR
jgi:hypothetical protein